MANLSIPGKLLICMVGRHHGDSLVKVAKAAGAQGGTVALGRTVNDSRILQLLSLADVSEDVVFTLLGSEADDVLSAIKKEASEAPKKFAGLAILMDVTSIFIRGTAKEKSVEADIANVRRDQMQSGYELISVIVNVGFADDVMAIARKAGAKGGTIINAHGTGTEEDVKFFGITLVPEKEMLFIVAEKNNSSNILKAINSIPNMCKPGGGIMFNMDVEQFVVLGNAGELESATT